MRAPLLLLCALTAGCATGASHRGPPLTPREEALVLLKKGDARGARERLERLYRDEPDNLELARALCEAHVQAGTAEALLARLVGQDRPVAHYMRGLLLFARAADATEPAIEAFERARTLAPQEAEFHYRLGLALLESERDAQALPELRSALQLQPTKVGWNLALAKALFRTGENKAAIAALKKLMEGSPTTQEVATARALMASASDPFADFPRAGRQRLEQGIQWLQVADVPQQAIAEFETLLREYPDLAVVHALLGLAYQRLDDVGRAVEEFKRAIELAPDDGKNHFYLAELYTGRQRGPAAREHYERAIERDPMLYDAWFRLGDLALERGDLASGALCFRTASLLDPASTPARGKLALAYQLQEDWPAAERELRAVVDRDPENLEFVLRLGVLGADHYRKAKSAAERAAAAREAEPWLKKILEVQPDNAIASAALQAIRGR